ncbi:hypothetical protein GWI33_006687 [Rhynchophorus ferrugineus]|uniref:Small ribosomal subunit protein mS35 mitochondrial conserved domain-containing protein n=1 Tax=Rhynchophorus ferrugineus TaxID=354439 RepID=A0A834IH76_RHYFE|nr:hypothetical protein GWI33_006687 [Rhynchophorus ferrugineus]
MLNLTKNIERIIIRNIEKQYIASYFSAPNEQNDDFKALNLKTNKSQFGPRRPLRKVKPVETRTSQMEVDQDWGSVWPAPRSFHPAVVPLPIRQGYVEKGAPPDKYANAELMKIPNFLHLTPPVIKRQCEALKKFCTPWPKNLNNQEKIEKLFPIEVISSDYCHSSPTIRDPLARIVTIRFKKSALNLNERETDKFRRLVGERYNEENDTVTIVTDRCPLKKQNYDYAMYLLTALYHESKNVEPWEELKNEADMEKYVWENNASKVNVERLFNKTSSEIPNISVYSEALVNYMNEGENDYTVAKYGEAVKQLLNLPSSTK